MDNLNKYEMPRAPIQVQMPLDIFESEKIKSFRYGKETGCEQLIQILHGYIGKTISRAQIGAQFKLDSADEERLNTILDKLTAWHEPEATFNGA